MFKGRSIESKKKLYSKIVENPAKSPSIDGNDILIVIHEPTLKNWGIAGGKMASEINLSYKIDV